LLLYTFPLYHNANLISSTFLINKNRTFALAK
jgi:hypothetical protein